MDLRIPPYCSIIVCPYCEPGRHRWGGRVFRAHYNVCMISGDHMATGDPCMLHRIRVDGWLVVEHGDEIPPLADPEDWPLE